MTESPETPEGSQRGNRRWFLRKAGEAGAAALLAAQLPRPTWSEEVKAPAASNAIIPQGTLVLAGGSVSPRDFNPDHFEGLDKIDPHHILRKLPKLASLPEESFEGKTVFVVTCASERRAEENAIAYKDKFEVLGAKVEVITNADMVNDPDKIKIMMSDPNVAGVWFDGGDQLKLEDEFHFKPGSLAFQMDNLLKTIRSDGLTDRQKHQLCCDITATLGLADMNLTPGNFEENMAALEEAIGKKYDYKPGDMVRALLLEICYKNEDDHPIFAYRRQKYTHRDNAPSEMFKAMEQRFLRDKNFFVAGTSAGAAVMPGQVVYKDQVDLEGFGLTKYFSSLLVDTHVDEHHIGKTVGDRYIVPDGAPLRGTIRIREALGLGKSKVGVALDGAVAVVLKGAAQTVTAIGEEAPPDHLKQAQFVVGGESEPRILKVGQTRAMSELGIILGAAQSAEVSAGGGGRE